MRSTTGFHFGPAALQHTAVYVNDMITSVNCGLFLYADDSTVLVSGKNPTAIQNRPTLRGCGKKSKNRRLLWKWVGGSRSHSEFFLENHPKIALNQY